jgi:very-short-patch-repair endonuclease
LGEPALISYLTAATLLRCDGCKTNALHVSALRECRRRTTGTPIVLHKVLSLPRSDRVVVDGIPCTSATRTLIDCAALLSDEALEVAFESARRMGLTTLRVFAARAAELCGPGRPGSRAIRALLAHQRPGDPALQYRLEVKLARLLRGSALPQLERQVAVGRYRIDFACSARRVGSECEGFEYHGNRLAWKRDKRRTAWLESQQWRLTFVTWDDVTLRPEETLNRIAFAIAAQR